MALKKQNTDKISGTELSDEQVQQIIKKKRGAKWTQELTAESGEPGDNARYVRYAMASWDLPPIDISDPVQVKNRIGEYLQYCAENDRKPQIVGLCNWIGITRETLNTWRNGEYRTGTHSDIIKKACAIIEEMWADFMLNGKINPASGIFLSKNWFNYSDTQQIVVTPNNPMQGMDADTARQRLEEAVPDDDE